MLTNLKLLHIIILMQTKTNYEQIAIDPRKQHILQIVVAVSRKLILVYVIMCNLWVFNSLLNNIYGCVIIYCVT